MKRILLFMLMAAAAIGTATAQRAGDTVEAPAKNDTESRFTISTLSDSVIQRMLGRSLPAGKEAWARETLRHLWVLHVGTDGKTHLGELVCNKAIASSLRSIFLQLYRDGYCIESIRLVDEYGGNDDLSMQHNNTSCFNYRTVEGTNRLSNHGRGLAIDVNPLYNPWVHSGRVSPAEGRPYAFNRSKVKAPVPIIGTSDRAYRLFRKHGFTWGGAWRSSKDYQHFEKKID